MATLRVAVAAPSTCIRGVRLIGRDPADRFANAINTSPPLFAAGWYAETSMPYFFVKAVTYPLFPGPPKMTSLPKHLWRQTISSRSCC